MARVKYKQDDSKVKSRLSGIERGAGNMIGAYDVIGSRIANRIRLGFKSSTSPYGGKWKKLKFRKGGQPLRDTNRLLGSIGHSPDAAGVDIGTNVLYAKIHNFGGTIKAKRAPYLMFKTPTGFARVKQVKIPARRFMPIRGGKISLPKPWQQSVHSALTEHFGLGK